MRSKEESVQAACMLCASDPTLHSICRSCAARVGELPGKLPALRWMMDQVPGLGLHAGLGAIDAAGLFLPPPLVEPTVEDLLAKVEAVRDAVLAVEAGWDGDSHGWGVWMSAVTAHDEVRLAFLRHSDGDARVFRGDFSKPEAELAERVGTALASALGVPFWFPARAKPEMDTARWHQRDRAVRCRVCDVMLAAASHSGRAGRCVDC